MSASVESFPDSAIGSAEPEEEVLDQVVGAAPERLKNLPLGNVFQKPDHIGKLVELAEREEGTRRCGLLIRFEIDLRLDQRNQIGK